MESVQDKLKRLAMEKAKQDSKHNSEIEGQDVSEKLGAALDAGHTMLYDNFPGLARKLIPQPPVSVANKALSNTYGGDFGPTTSAGVGREFNQEAIAPEVYDTAEKQSALEKILGYKGHRFK